MEFSDYLKRGLPRRHFLQKGIKTGLTIAAAPAVVGTLASCGAPDVEEAVDQPQLAKTIAERFERTDLAHLPTPLEKMNNLTSLLGGPEIYIKRDDHTGLAFGGNKSRKLEFIIADALQKKSDVIITTGGVQSNWCRQTAAAARIFDIKPILVLAKKEAGAVEFDGNLLLDHILGADIRLIEPGTDRSNITERIAEEERNQGHNPYLVPVGGSRVGGNMQEPLGAVAYTQAFIEIYTEAQQKNIPLDHVIIATGSGGTQAGLVVGAKALAPHVQIVGISISGRKESIQQNVAAIANQTSSTLGLELSFESEEIIVFDDYVGEGYGVMYQEAADAIATVARNEGILLDPVYTSKAMAGLMDLIGKGTVKKGEGALFIHTGGTPALFPYKDKLMKLIKQS